MGIKRSVPQSPQYDYDAMRQFSDIFNVIDNSNQPVRCHQTRRATNTYAFAVSTPRSGSPAGGPSAMDVVARR